MKKYTILLYALMFINFWAIMYENITIFVVSIIIVVVTIGLIIKNYRLWK